MKYVTRFANALHRVAEEIRNIIPKVDELILNIKKNIFKSALSITKF